MKKLFILFLLFAAPAFGQTHSPTLPPCVNGLYLQSKGAATAWGQPLTNDYTIEAFNPAVASLAGGNIGLTGINYSSLDTTTRGALSFDVASVMPFSGVIDSILISVDTTRASEFDTLSVFNTGTRAIVIPFGGASAKGYSVYKYTTPVSFALKSVLWMVLTPTNSNAMSWIIYYHRA